MYMCKAMTMDDLSTFSLNICKLHNYGKISLEEI